MNRLFPGFLTAFVLLTSAMGAMAAGAHNDKETKEDIARHRTISTAHEAAARCLEAGKTEDVCHKELQAACKGIAIGKYCGMKHGH